MQSCKRCVAEEVQCWSVLAAPASMQAISNDTTSKHQFPATASSGAIATVISSQHAAQSADKSRDSQPFIMQLASPVPTYVYRHSVGAPSRIAARAAGCNSALSLSTDHEALLSSTLGYCCLLFLQVLQGHGPAAGGAVCTAV